MKILRVKSIVITIALAIVALGQNNSETKETEQSLLSREITLSELHDVGTPTIFQIALLNANLPGGVVAVSCDASPKKYFVAPQSTSLETLLINLEQTDPNYRWQLDNGVVNLLPRKGMPMLLETPIKKFNVSNVTGQEALNLLQEKSEVKIKKAELGLDKAVISINKASSLSLDSEQNNTPTFNLNLKGATFRQILNEIVKAQGRGTWIYTEKHCGNTSTFSVILIE